MGLLKRKQLIRDMLKEYQQITVPELARYLDMTPLKPREGDRRYRLLRSACEALVDDGIVGKIEDRYPVEYYLKNTRRETATHEEILFKRWEDELANHHGWHGFEDLKQITGSTTMTPLTDYLISPFLEFVNKRGRIQIRRTKKGGNGRRYFVDTQNPDRYKELKADLPAGEDLIDEALNKGKSPSTIAAVIEWLTTDKLQKEAAQKYDRTPEAVRNNRDWVEARLAELEGDRDQ